MNTQYREPCVKVYERKERYTTEYAVWLDPGGDNFMGLCIGTGSSREQALTDAVASLERAIKQIQDGKAE